MNHKIWIKNEFTLMASLSLVWGLLIVWKYLNQRLSDEKYNLWTCLLWYQLIYIKYCVIWLRNGKTTDLIAFNGFY